MNYYNDLSYANGDVYVDHSSELYIPEVTLSRMTYGSGRPNMRAAAHAPYAASDASGQTILQKFAEYLAASVPAAGAPAANVPMPKSGGIPMYSTFSSEAPGEVACPHCGPKPVCCGGAAPADTQANRLSEELSDVTKKYNIMLIVLLVIVAYVMMQLMNLMNLMNLMSAKLQLLPQK